MNQVIGGGLLAAGLCGMGLTAYVYVFVTNESPQWDGMGADMLFDGMWLLATPLLTIGVGLILQIAWFWCIALFLLAYVIGGYFAKILLGRIIRRRRRGS